MGNATPGTIAAVDLGSNSFHLIVAKTDEDNFQVVDRMREMVQLAVGMDDDRNLADKAMARAFDCLERFGERLSDLPQSAVRAVGTNALRKARNAFSFLSLAETTLGHGIDVISGHEEARLIYLGVSHGLDDESDLRMVMDIGGGSTEFILGRRFDPLYTESKHMGCVSLSSACFADGTIDSPRMRGAEIAARQELESMEESFRRIGWDTVIGASGTILSVRDIVIAHGWSEEGITPAALAKLRRAMLDAGHVDKLEFMGLSEERRPVFPGGVAILIAAFEAFGIDSMRVSDSALREGLLYDLLGRIHQEDVRERTVKELAQRYQVDIEQGERVRETAEGLLKQVAESWDLEAEEYRRTLRWAAVLHEIGLSISHSQYHKHGGYLLSNLNMPGFAHGEQRRLAALVRGHRRKMPVGDFGKLPAVHAEAVTRLCALLRLAIMLHRRRSEDSPPPITISAEDRVIRLRYPPEWLDTHALSRADLEQEAVYLKAAAFKLKYK
jgi:exopolyphosphatase / guanosine-5'-triphosphate,3'-diphosphate pyrophosphatase